MLRPGEWLTFGVLLRLDAELGRTGIDSGSDGRGHGDHRWEHDRRRGGHLGREGTAHLGCGVAGRTGGWSEGPNLGFRGGDIPGVWETLATPKTLRI